MRNFLARFGKKQTYLPSQIDAAAKLVFEALTYGQTGERLRGEEEMPHELHEQHIEFFNSHFLKHLILSEGGKLKLERGQLTVTREQVPDGPLTIDGPCKPLYDSIRTALMLSAEEGPLNDRYASNRLRNKDATHIEMHRYRASDLMSEDLKAALAPFYDASAEAWPPFSMVMYPNGELLAKMPGQEQYKSIAYEGKPELLPFVAPGDELPALMQVPMQGGEMSKDFRWFDTDLHLPEYYTATKLSSAVTIMGDARALITVPSQSWLLPSSSGHYFHGMSPEKLLYRRASGEVIIDEDVRIEHATNLEKVQASQAKGQNPIGRA